MVGVLISILILAGSTCISATGIIEADDCSALAIWC